MKNFLNILILTGVIALAAGCGKQQKLEVPQEFASYVEQFEKKSEDSGQALKIGNLVMKFTDLSASRERGNCELNGSETAVINIDPVVWQRLTVAERKALLFHELGHCCRGRKHFDGRKVDGNPASLMATYPLNKTYIETYEGELDGELFTKEGEIAEGTQCKKED